MCVVCAEQVLVSSRFKGRNVRCENCRNLNLEIESIKDSIEDAEDEYFEHVKDLEEFHADAFREEDLYDPPPSRTPEIIRPHEWVFVDVTGPNLKPTYHCRRKPQSSDDK